MENQVVTDLGLCQPVSRGNYIRRCTKASADTPGCLFATKGISFRNMGNIRLLHALKLPVIFHLVMSAIYNLPQLGNRGAYLVQQMEDKLVEHRQYIAQYGVDLPEVTEWKWK